MPESAASPQTYSDSQAWLSLAPTLASGGEWQGWLKNGEQQLEDLASKANRALGNGRGVARAVSFSTADGIHNGVWRINHHGGLLGKLQADRYSDATRLQEEVALSAKLRALGVPTPEVLLAFAKRHGAWWRQHLVTREVAGASTVFDARENAAALEASTKLLQQLFDVGLWATDLHPGNLLWQFDTGNCWLIDLAGAELRTKPLTPPQRKARVERFARYFVKHAGCEPTAMMELRRSLCD